MTEDPRKVMIEVGINGTAKRERNRAVPYSSSEIISCCKDVATAGASIIHFHLRTPNGECFEDYDVYKDIIKEVRDNVDVLIWLPIPFGDDATKSFSILERLMDSDDVDIDIAALEIGSFIIGSFSQSGEFIGEYRYLNYLPNIIKFAKKMMDNGVVPIVPIFDVSFLRTVNLLEANGVLRAPFAIALYFGGNDSPLGLPPTPLSLDAYAQIARLDERPWFGGGVGVDIAPFTAELMRRGGHIRVGLEDYHHHDAHSGARSNAEVVRSVADRIRQLGHQVASAEDARQILRRDRQAAVCTTGRLSVGSGG